MSPLLGGSSSLGAGGLSGLPVFDAKRFGARESASDNWAALQAWLDEAKGSELGAINYLPPGDFKTQQPLTWNATVSGYSPGPLIWGAGANVSRIINEVAGGAALAFYQTGASRFTRGGLLQDFGISTVGAPATSDGISLGAVNGLEIRRLAITGLSRDPIRVKQLLGDTDYCVDVTLERNYFASCAGRAVNVELGTDLASVSGWRIIGNRVESCGGAFRLHGYRGLLRDNVTSLCATSPDIEFYYNNVHANGWSILDNWFEKGRVGVILAPGLVGARVWGNHIIYNDASSGLYGFDLGGASGPVVEDSEFGHNRWVVSGPASFTAYNMRATCDFNMMGIDRFDTFSGSYIRYAPTGPHRNEIQERTGRTFGAVSKVNTKTVTNGSNLTPDLNEGEVVRATFTGATGTLTFPSIGRARGRWLTVDIANASGGATTVTLAGNVLQSGYTNPGNGLRTTGRFYYSDDSAAWVLVGSWSPAM